MVFFSVGVCCKRTILFIQTCVYTKIHMYIYICLYIYICIRNTLMKSKVLKKHPYEVLLAVLYIGREAQTCCWGFLRDILACRSPQPQLGSVKNTLWAGHSAITTSHQRGIQGATSKACQVTSLQIHMCLYKNASLKTVQYLILFCHFQTWFRCDR